jgi:hypothetical protein
MALCTAELMVLCKSLIPRAQALPAMLPGNLVQPVQVLRFAVRQILGLAGAGRAARVVPHLARRTQPFMAAWATEAVVRRMALPVGVQAGQTCRLRCLMERSQLGVQGCAVVQQVVKLGFVHGR